MKLFSRIALAALMLAPALAHAEVAVTAARIAPGAERTRFTLDLTGPLTFQTFTLPDPYRAVIDLPKVEWRIFPTPPPATGLIGGFRFGPFRPDTARVVLDLKAPARIAYAQLLAPDRTGGYRLIVDLERESEAEALRDAAKPPAAPAATAPAAPALALPAPPPNTVGSIFPPSLLPPRGQPPPDAPPREAAPPPQQASLVRVPPLPTPKPQAGPRRADRFTIVIDPGHGGVDPGALGRGAQEKHVTLDYARELRRQINATRTLRAVLTRDADIFVPLRERIAIARVADADMFISLHADANEDVRLRGASVYTLSETASDKEAEALAAKENKADLIAGVDLRGHQAEVVNILIDLAQRETMNQSVLLAQFLVNEIAPVVPLIRNTHRFAGFAVLKAPDTPAVLIEMGHLSNARDEAEMRDPAHRRKFAAAVVRAVAAYAARVQASHRP